MIGLEFIRDSRGRGETGRKIEHERGHLKVLFVTNMYPHRRRPDYGTFVQHQVSKIRELGHIVDILVIQGYLSKMNYIRGALAILKLTLRRGYDVVHAHYGLCGLVGTSRWGVPLVVTLHGSDVFENRLQRALSRIGCLTATKVIVVSKEIEAKIRGKIIPCGVDLRVFKEHDKLESRRRLDLALDKKLILFPYDPRRRIKRFDIAVKVKDTLLRKGFDCDLIVAAGVENEKMPLYYSAADVMLLCSDREGSPTSVKEALACNTPVVAADVGDVREIMDGVTGCSVCTQDAVSLAAAVEKVFMFDPETCFNGRESMQRYDQERVGRDLEEVYWSALKKRHRI